jgi:hypothetical protein
MKNTHLAEIFPLTYSELNLASFRLSPTIDKKLGNSLGWHFSKRFPGVVVVWEKGGFWILAQPSKEIPSKEDWKAALEDILTQLKERSKDNPNSTASLSSYFIQWMSEPTITASIIAQLAVRILQINCCFTSPIISDLERLQVRRECEFWAETVEINNQITPSISLTPTSVFLYKESLEHFFNNHPYRNEPEKLLTDLLVRDIDTNSTATLVGINGVICEHRDKLLKQAKGAISKEKLLTAPDEQPVVRIQFGKNSYIYDYAMAALCPCITPKTASKFNVEYGTLLKHTKIKYIERQKLLRQYKQEAEKILIDFALNLNDKSINSRKYPDLFWIPKTKLEDTLLLFGNSVKCPKSKTLKGLSEGGVYYRHEKFKDINRPIRLAVLNFTSLRAVPFFAKLEEQLKIYKFPVHITQENVRK